MQQKLCALRQISVQNEMGKNYDFNFDIYTLTYGELSSQGGDNQEPQAENNIT